MISAHDREILSRLPEWNPTGDIAAQRREWEELATVYNQDLPAIGGFEKNIELRAGLTADVAVPKGAGPHPVMIYLHGGGWAFGSPASFRKLGMQFAEAGYLTIVLDYRLARIRCSPYNGRATTRGDGTATGRASRSAAIPRAETRR
jgi:acetyl esterase/lipase